MTNVLGYSLTRLRAGPLGILFLAGAARFASRRNIVPFFPAGPSCSSARCLRGINVKLNANFLETPRDFVWKVLQVPLSVHVTAAYANLHVLSGDSHSRCDEAGHVILRASRQTRRAADPRARSGACTADPFGGPPLDRWRGQCPRNNSWVVPVCAPVAVMVMREEFGSLRYSSFNGFCRDLISKAASKNLLCSRY